MQDSVVFSHLMEEYGSLDQEKHTGGYMKSKGDASREPEKLHDKNAGADLMQVEERNTGAVTWGIYSKYLQFAGSLLWAPVIVLLLTLLQLSAGDRSSL
jgi:ATP-binding cassette, subfamily C (CFTR/MRP), member 1